jgi:hypothetical protein
VTLVPNAVKEIKRAAASMTFDVTLFWAKVLLMVSIFVECDGNAVL